MDEQLAERVGRIFGRVFGRSVVFDPSLKRVDEPGWTSLKHVEFLIALESEFGTRFDGADATDMTSIPVVIERLRQRLR